MPHGFALKNADGKSGGLIAVWDTNKFTLQSKIEGDGYLAITGNWQLVAPKCRFIIVYASQCIHKKEKLWMDLRSLLRAHDSLSIVLGDFNEVSLGSKLSKLDRFLVSSHFVDLWPNSHALALAREFSDHTPIILCNSTTDFGPVPFKFYNSWIELNDLKPIVQASWTTTRPRSSMLVTFKVKLQSLKVKLKDWRRGDSQTAFIKGRQIIDGPLMVDEIISWAKMYKKKLFMLKVDFEKAFDSLSWPFLDSTMMQMGFSLKWRQWMRACLNSGYTSVLVNGSPTSKFKIERGLRQGDPLSPLLFILAFEALNVVLTEAKNKNLFKELK
uniref:Cysteine-rich receptor-like protein kinase n=1 Tax=Tanacetum cinerariifolium TaxID=118510 RepID=A0A6L2MU00_TANCI|nr:cysteine-rich receptor-like protein kinase [Tanacetum cinerariifolium]